MSLDSHPININIKTFHKEMGCDSTEIKSGSLSRLSHSTASDEFLVLKSHALLNPEL